jgi:hypothetical protein
MSQIDLQVTGVEPLILRTNYISRKGLSENGGWFSLTDATFSYLGAEALATEYKLALQERAMMKPFASPIKESAPIPNSFKSQSLSATSSMNAKLLKNKLIAEEISGGHAFKKHVIQQNEFPGFSRLDFERHIRNVLNNPTDMKPLLFGRTGYWDQLSGTVIVRDPFRIDGGTVFRPSLGRRYYDDVLR